MPDAYMQYEAADTVYRWRGGAYIDIGSIYAAGAAGIHGDDFHAYDVINVWDYAAGAPSIPRTLDGFKERCEQHRRACPDCGEHPCECGDD